MKHCVNEKRKLMVSTDVGVFCTPEYILNLYGGDAARVEVIGWLWAENFLKRARNSGVWIERLHGRIGDPGSGGKTQWRGLVLQSLLLSSRNLIKLGNQYGIGRLLVHAGEARESFEEMKKSARDMEICVENSLGGEVGLEAAFELAARFLALGIKSSVVGDVGHYGAEIGRLDNPEATILSFIGQADRWEEKYKVKVGVHLPVHAEMDEGAVDIDQVSDETLSKFLHRFDEVVVENRADLRYEFLPAAFPGYKDRSRRRWERISRLFAKK